MVSYVLNQPFGKEQKFLSGVSNGAVQRVISGWTLNGITTLQDGFPVSITANEPTGTVNMPITYVGSTGGYGSTATLYPNLVAGCGRKQVTGSFRQNVVSGNPVFINKRNIPLATVLTVHSCTYKSIPTGRHARGSR